MKKLLIIRSVSFQQLDTNLKTIKEEFPKHEIHLLTHEHGEKLAKKYKDIKKIWIYPYKQGFGYNKRCKELKKERFDDLIVPCTNLSGTGFMNVFLFSLTIPAKRYWCNMISEIKPFYSINIIIWWMRSQVYKLIALILSGFLGCIGFGIVFLIKILNSQKSSKIK